MLNKFWSWLLGFDKPKSTPNAEGGKTAPSAPSANGDEGNNHSGPDGYQSGGYEGR
jgi:hypothetical protein